MMGKRILRAAPLAALMMLAACSGGWKFFTFGTPAGKENAERLAEAPSADAETDGDPAEAAGADFVEAKALFEEKCGMCHGTVGMGTGLISRRIEPALLSKRTDLTVEFVMQAARIGMNNMPAIPRGEVSDEQLRTIAEYLSRKQSAQ